jgi:hypothetical protein
MPRYAHRNITGDFTRHVSANVASYFSGLVVPSISFFSLLSSLFSLLDQPLVHQLQL